jgi:hypothetical protein
LVARACFARTSGRAIGLLAPIIFVLRLRPATRGILARGTTASLRLRDLDLPRPHAPARFTPRGGPYKPIQRGLIAMHGR